MKYTIKDVITICSLHLSSLDGDIDEREIGVIIDDGFLSKYYNDKSKDLFISLKKEDLLNDEFFSNTFKPILSKESKKTKLGFISSLVKIGQSDGSLDEVERKFITVLSDTSGLTSNDLKKIFDDYGKNNSEYSVGDAVIISALCVASIDGNIDDEEWSVVRENPFFKKYYTTESLDKATEIIKSEDNSLLKVIKNDLGFLINETESFKKSFINAIVKVVISGENFGKNELSVLDTISGIVGLTKSQVDLFINEENERIKKETEELKKQNTTNSQKESSSCFVVTATMGDTNHPIVNDFRKYRDNNLTNSFVGNIFINVYYYIGPYLANLIERSSVLKNFSFKFIITPLHNYIKKN